MNPRFTPAKAALLAGLTALIAAGVRGAEPGQAITYTLSRPMRVSLNIYDQQGQIVRSLLHGAPRPAGLQREFWDGRDQSGKPLPPGEYAWKTLAMPGRLKTEFLCTVGANYPDPEPDPARETEQFREVAPGTHGGPTAVAADASGVYVGASCTENIENYLVKVSHDGKKRLWSKLHREAWNGALAMALSGDRLLVLSTHQGEIWPYQAADGTDLPTLGTALAPDAKGEKDPDRFPSDLAANDREMVLTFPGRGLVRWCNPTNGVVTRELAGLDRPVAVAIASDGTTYAVCGTTVLRFDRSGGSHATLVTGLSKPGRIALTTTGDLLVYEAANEQILRFTTEGRRLGVFGQVGGRRDGRYDRTAQESFLKVSALARAPGGGFLVAEPWTAPRRAAWFNADGQLVREWYGGHVWAPWIAVDPEDTRTLFMPSSWDSIMRLELDYARKTWRVRSVHHLSGMADEFCGAHDNALLYRAFRHEGKLYLGRCQWPWTVLRVDDASDQLVPVLAVHPQMRHNWEQKPVLVREGAADGDKAFAWTDANGDGRPQPNEVKFYKKDGGWPGLPEWLPTGIVAVRDKFIHRWQITGWNSVGAPLMGDFPAGTPLLELPPRALAGKGLEGRWGSYITQDSRSGIWFVAINASMTDWGRSTDSFMTSYNADGSRRWIVGGRTVGSPQSHLAPGDIGCFRRIAGTTHGCVVVNDFQEGEWPLTSYVWDSDGLWVGGVMDEIDRRAAPVWRYGAGGESLGTVMVNDPRTGDVLLFWHGYNDVRVGRVTGWDGWVRASGKLSLSTAAPSSTPILTAVPLGKGQGLMLEAWDLDRRAPEGRPSFQRLTDLQSENWGPGKGPDGIRSFDGRMVRVTGELEAFQSGWHAFAAEHYPAKTRYRIAGIELHRRSFNEVELVAGQRYPVEIVYDPTMTHPTTDQGIRLKWATPRGTWPGAWTPISVSQLYAPASAPDRTAPPQRAPRS
ncbi:MAG: hypothetical protein HS113_09205 [Verrucomicrobiales bacterium]|nr:hypothetical protein [Verrucomicrobiales bacterium]